MRIISGKLVWYCLLSDKPGENFVDQDLPPERAQYLLRACQRAEESLARALADAIRTLWTSWPYAQPHTTTTA